MGNFERNVQKMGKMGNFERNVQNGKMGNFERNVQNGLILIVRKQNIKKTKNKKQKINHGFQESLHAPDFLRDFR